MSAPAVATDPGAAGQVEARDRWVGTGALVRFGLRRDRFRLPVWIVVVTFLAVVSLLSFVGNYVTEADRVGIAASLDTPAMAALTGPDRYLANYTYASMLGHQMTYLIAVALAIMTVLLVVRHTRMEEETGRAELIRAGVVGRHAHLTAALVIATIANLAAAGALTVALAILGVDSVGWGEALLFSTAVASVGLVFAGVAAVAAQVTEHSRGASGIGLALVGLAYALRAVGDAGDTPAVSWLSPIGWAQRTYVGVDDHWWPLLLPVGGFLLLGLVAGWLSTRRDVGAGLRRPRSGRAAASGALVRPLGFALRLHRGLLIGFGVGAALGGAAYGSVFGELEEMLANIELAEELLDQLEASAVDGFATVILLILAVVVAAYVVLAALRPRTEELAGRAEPVLVTGVSRTRWLASHLTVVLVGSAAVMVAAGAAFGAAAAGTTGDPELFGRITAGSLVYLPALWLTAGLAVALYGWWPRGAGLVWLVPAYGFVVGYLGQLLSMPDWLANLSPFGHVPQLPAHELRWTPLLVLTLIAAALIGLGLAGFRRRDVSGT